MWKVATWEDWGRIGNPDKCLDQEHRWSQHKKEILHFWACGIREREITDSGYKTKREDDWSIGWSYLDRVWQAVIPLLQPMENLLGCILVVHGWPQLGDTRYIWWTRLMVMCPTDLCCSTHVHFSVVAVCSQLWNTLYPVSSQWKKITVCILVLDASMARSKLEPNLHMGLMLRVMGTEKEPVLLSHCGSGVCTYHLQSFYIKWKK